MPSTDIDGGHLRVAADGPILALPILSRLKIARPKLTFSLAIDNSAMVMEQIVDYRADVAIIAGANGSAPSRRAFSLHAPWALRGSHPSAGKTPERDHAGTARASFIMRERGSRTREIFEMNLADHGVTVVQIAEISPREGVPEALANRVGCGVVADLEFGHDARLAFVPIDDAGRTIDEYAVCPAERTVASAADPEFHRRLARDASEMERKPKFVL